MLRAKDSEVPHHSGSTPAIAIRWEGAVTAPPAQDALRVQLSLDHKGVRILDLRFQGA